MMVSYETLRTHLERTGRMKLLPQILRELQAREVKKNMRASRTETAEENPTLLSGARSIQDGILTDTTGKRALLEIYQNITNA